MKNIFFSENFKFHTVRFEKYHYTDNRKGSPHHYLAFMEKGSSRIVSSDVTIEIEEGDVFYIPKGLSYQSFWRSDKEIIFKSLGFDFFPESNSKHFLLQKIECGEAVKSQIRNIPTEQTVNSILLAAFYFALSTVLPIMKYRDPNPKKQIIERARKFILNNIDCKISDVSKHCLLSESALYEIFKREAGITPNEMRQEILCEKAVLFLTTTDKSVQEISDSLGFSSTSYFRKILNKHIGKTPREIRKELQY